MCVCLRARSRIHTHTHQVWTPPQDGCCGGAYCRPRLDAPSSSPRTRWRRRKACVTGSESLWMDGFAVSASPPASRAAMVACFCSRLSALLHARTHTHTHTLTHTYTHKRPCSSMVPSGCGNHTPIDALTLLIIMPFYRPRADRRGSRQGCPGPQTGGEAVAALSQHLLPCRHVHLRAAGTRHKAVAGVRGHDRRPQGEAATEAPCRNSDAVHASCFVRVVYVVYSCSRQTPTCRSSKQTPRCLTPKPTLAHAGPGADELGHLFLHAGGRIHQDCSAGSGGCAVATIDSSTRDSGPARSVLAPHASFCQK